jgi:hypothetical protein
MYLRQRLMYARWSVQVWLVTTGSMRWNQSNFEVWSETTRPPETLLECKLTPWGTHASSIWKDFPRTWNLSSVVYSYDWGEIPLTPITLRIDTNLYHTDSRTDNYERRIESPVHRRDSNCTQSTDPPIERRMDAHDSSGRATPPTFSRSRCGVLTVHATGPTWADDIRCKQGDQCCGFKKTRSFQS